jgi:transcriptional regulator with XRE-family HTH domain
MKDRLQKVLTAEGLAPTKFAEIIGVQRSSISHILSGRNKPSFDVINSILENFPKLNPDWLLMGKGSMYRGPVQTSLFTNTLGDSNQNVTQTQNKEINLSGFDEKTIEIKAPENRISEKKVDRVVVFYSDKTFTEYKPE